MTHKTKKTIALSSVSVCAAAAIIFGGPFIANRLQAEKSAPQPASTEAVAQTNSATDIAPIETETVYDENGKIAIEPETPTTDTTPAAAPADAASTGSSTHVTAEKPAAPAQTEPKTVTKQAAPATSTASAPKQPTTTTTAKKSSSSSSTTTKAKSTTSSSTTTTKPKETTSTPSTSQPQNGEIRDGKMYVEGEWVEIQSGGGSIQMEDQGGDWNKMVGN